MKTTYFLLVALTLSTSISKVIGSVGDGSFFESDADFKRIHRNLLQADYENDGTDELNDGEKGDETTEEEEEKKEGLFTPETPLLGPTRFYDGEQEFLMEVDKGITIITTQGSTTLDASAISITGSYTVPGRVYEVAIDWKDKFGGVQINMVFNKSRTEFTLIEMELTMARKKYELMVSTSNGYKVVAPRGLAFACDVPGLFEAKNVGVGEDVRGITFPGMKVQVFFKDWNLRKFGPLWYCGEIMPIGLWVGIMVSIFFTLICYWGFSMLASIQTMDRFDDPKGKQIYVPQSD